MKKKIISLLTTLVMVVGLVGVVPTVSASAEGFDIKKCLFYDYPSYLSLKTEYTSEADAACYEVMSSYSENDENMAALLKSLSNGGDILIQDFFANLGIGVSYEEELQRKAVMSYLNTSTETSVQFKKSVNKVSKWFGTAKSMVGTFDSQIKVKECLSEIAQEQKTGLTYEQLSAITDNIYGKSEEIVSAIGDTLGAVTDACKIASFALESFELYLINVDYIGNLMQAIPSTSTLYDALSLVRDDLLDPVKYFSDKILSNECIKGICKLADWWTPSAYKIFELAVSIYTNYFSPWADADDIIVTYYLDSYTGTIENKVSETLNNIKLNGATDEQIEKFKFLYNEYVSCLRAECKSAAGMAKKDDEDKKSACNASYNLLEAWDYESLLNYWFTQLHLSGKIEFSEAVTSDYKYEVIDEVLKTASITAYTGSESFVDIPSKIDGYTIVGIGNINTFTFDSNDSIIAVNIPDSVKDICAFYSCDNLISVKLPNSLESIAGFSNCDKLTSIDIPDNTKKILSGAFCNCDSLVDVRIPKNIEYIAKKYVWSIYSGAFDYTPWLASLYDAQVDGILYIQNIAYAYIGNFPSDGTVTIRDGTITLGDYLFAAPNNYASGGLKNVVLPESLKNIGNYCFQYRSGLKSITIPDNVNKIGSYAFYSCNYLSTVNLSKNLKSIGVHAFRNCSLTSIEIPASLETAAMGEKGGPFYRSGLKSVVFEEGTIKIADYVLYGCSKLTDVIIPSGVTNIGDGAFSHCDSLTSVTIPDSVTSIGDFAFSHCDSLTSVTIPDSVTSIGDEAFSHCDSLTSVTIPDSVTSLGAWAFSDCTSLTDVTIGNSVTIIYNSAFSSCISLTSITIPDSVTSIVGSAFYGCDNLTIYCYSGSYAQQYAIKNKINYELLDDEDLVPLEQIDINGDGNISTADVGLINAHAKGTKLLSGEALKKADVNKDGKVSTADVGLINAYAKGTKKYA